MSKDLEIFFCTLPVNVIIEHGWYNNNRVSLMEPNVCVFANRTSLFSFKVPYNPVKPNPEKTKNCKVPFPTFVPRFETFEVSKLRNKNSSLTEISHRGEVIYCTDERGNISVCKYRRGIQFSMMKDDDRMIDEQRVVKKRKLDISPLQIVSSIENKNPPFESGCSFISIHPNDIDYVVNSMYFSQEIRLYKNGEYSQNYYFSGFPTAVKFFTRNNSSVLGVIEEKEILVFDDRVSKKVGKIQPRSGSLKTFEAKENVVAVSDNSRGVMLFDIRKWNVYKKIKKSLKAGICYTKFSKTKDFLLISGSNELFCSLIEGKSKSKDSEIYFDSKLLGIDIMKDDVDTITTISKSGKVYFLRNVSSIL